MNDPFIEENIAKIEQSISLDSFVDIESSVLEIKDLSTGSNWTSLNESICAFLNTNGGFVFCGIRERDRKYEVTGFDRRNESNIIKLHTSTFKNSDGVLLDLSKFIYFDYYTINARNENKEILVLYILPLSDDLKYAYLNNGEAFERKLTQDKRISNSKIQLQAEYKNDLEHARELMVVENADLSDFSIDKINNYVVLLNKEIKRETIKANLKSAKPFLANQHFIKQDKITLLGMLVCGEDPFHFLSSRVEVNAYFDTAANGIATDKKIFRTDVLNLIEETFRYIWGNIKINRTYNNGGLGEPEYPENVIRETIINAIAHRDYSIENFISVSVEPNQFIEVRNPGSFKEQIKILDNQSEVQIRRLIPGIPESKNPKLASILRVFDKIESQGRGMATLVNAAFDNKVDLAYYEIREGMIILRVPSGQLVDDAIESWVKGFQNYIEDKLRSSITDEHKAVLAYFYKSEVLNKRKLFTILLSESNNHYDVIHELKESGLILEHPISSESAPVYILDRVLMKLDFREEMIHILGDEYMQYPSVAKEILNLVYLCSKYNKSSLKAAELTPEVYRRLYGKIILPNVYESLGRKIRATCNSFNKMGLFKKDLRNAYFFDSEFQNPNRLF